MIKKNEER